MNETCLGCRYLSQSPGMNACERYGRYEGDPAPTILTDDPPTPLFLDDCWTSPEDAA